MAPHELAEVVVYLVVLLLLVKPLGAYMARVYQGKPVLLDRVLGPVERLIYRACGVSADDEMDWKTYAVAMLVFGAASALVVYAMQRLQGFLPMNPQHLGAVSRDSGPIGSEGRLEVRSQRHVGPRFIGAHAQDLVDLQVVALKAHC